MAAIGRDAEVVGAFSRQLETIQCDRLWNEDRLARLCARRVSNVDLTFDLDADRVVILVN